MNTTLRNLIAGASLVAAIPAALNGQQRPLTVEEAISLGLENSKSLHSSSMRVQAADSRSGEAHASMLPTLKAAGSYTRLSDVPPFVATVPRDAFGKNFPPQEVSFPLSQTILNNYGLRLSLQQPLFTGLRLQSGVDMAEYDAQAAEQDYNKDKSQLVYDIRNAYWSLYKAMEFTKVIDENIQQVKAHLAEIQSQSAQGTVTRNEVLRVEVQLSNTELSLLSSQNNVRLAAIGLCNLIGLPLNTGIEPTSQVSAARDTSLRIDALIRQAVEARPEVAAMQYRVKAGESAVTLARSGWYPQIYLTGNYYYARPNQRIVPTLDEFRDTWDLGVSVSLDIWNWGSTIQQTNQAQAQLAEANDVLGQLRDAIQLEVTQSYLNVNESGERIGVAEKAIAQAEENYRITNAKFKAGLALNSDLLDAESGLLQAKWNHIQALVDHEVARAQLARVSGGA